MATHDKGQITYLRKDGHFFKDGVWYITTPCPVHGLVDEEVPWDEAKTPHHAGLIADARHHACHQSLDAQRVAESAQAEIEAAERLLDDQRATLARIETEHELAKKVGGTRLRLSTELVNKHREGLTHAERRVRETREQNTARIRELQELPPKSTLKASTA